MTKKGKGKSNSAPMALLVAGGVALVGLFGYGVYQGVKDDQQRQQMADRAKTNEAGCTGSPVRADIPGVERIPCKSNAHVKEGEKVTYDQNPPLSGAHWGVTVSPGFYDSPQTTEKLVHNLEHGHVVIYYDKAKLSPDELNVIKTTASKFKGSWDGVVAVPRTDPGAAVIATAWEHRLVLAKFEQSRLDAFVDAFRGRGPENPVRPLK